MSSMPMHKPTMKFHATLFNSIAYPPNPGLTFHLTLSLAYQNLEDLTQYQLLLIDFPKWLFSSRPATPSPHRKWPKTFAITSGNKLSATEEHNMPHNLWRTSTNSPTPQPIFPLPTILKPMDKLNESIQKSNNTLVYSLISRQTDWNQWLSCAEFTYNNKVQTSTGFSPFYVNLGRHPHPDVSVTKDIRSQSDIEFTQSMKNIWEETGASLWLATEQIKHFYPYISTNQGQSVVRTI